MKLTAEAQQYFDGLAESYVQARFPNYKTWGFDKGGWGPVYDELKANRLIELMGTRGAAWRLTGEGQHWIMTHQESDEVRYARRVFGAFQKSYAENVGAGGVWWIPQFDDKDAAEVGLEIRQARIGLQVLIQTRLITADASGERHLELTEFGKDTCLHPETLRVRLGPRGGGALVDARTSNTFHGPTQVGDGNVQNVTYTIVLQQLIQQIEQSPNIEPEKKSRWVDAIKDIIASGLGEIAVKGIGTILGGG